MTSVPIVMLKRFANGLDRMRTRKHRRLKWNPTRPADMYASSWTRMAATAFGFL